MLRVADIAENMLREFRMHPPEADSPVESSRETAKRFGVSLLTADRAIKQLVELGVLYRVSGKGTFFREISSDFKKTPLIGFAACFNTDSVQRNELNQISLALLRRNYQVRVIMHHELKDPVIGPRELSGLDALVMTSDLMDDDIRSNLAKFHKPVITMYRDFPFEESMNQVIFDLHEAFEEAVSLIRDREKREFVLIHEPHSNAWFRLETFKNALLRNGVPEKHISEVQVSRNRYWELKYVPGPEKIMTGLKGKFIFCTSDVIAARILDMLKSSGITAGKDFEFLGCDNQESEGIGLSTIDCHASKIPGAMLKLLDDCLKNQDNFRRSVAIPGTLMIRKTALNYS